MGEDKFTRNLRNGGQPSEEDIAREIWEDRRLVEMGIDPNGDPIEIMQLVKARRKALHADDNKK